VIFFAATTAAAAWIRSAPVSASRPAGRFGWLRLGVRPLGRCRWKTASGPRTDIDAAEEPVARMAEIEDRLNKPRSPFRSAETFWVEEIIDPRETRPCWSISSIRRRRSWKPAAAISQSGPRAVSDQSGSETVPAVFIFGEYCSIS